MQNYTIFSVIAEDDKVEAAFDLIQDVCGDLEDPGTGIVFVIPVSRAIGIAPELGEESEL